jgi:predicted RNA-binding Zn-ribbon protein involved in translation (DUF1610 family)
MTKFPVFVWLCPDCGNYYGSSHAGDLTKKLNFNLQNKPTFARSRCPDCGGERVRCGMEIELTPKESVATQ